ncbi:helix-turn-helix domain-containing protein [Streptomyces boncukensis]|uniref:helix-turn-helix domain-containing protein n=1 Tax=Streptomyces boncukensis TaxID=2711219 RepID=UPI001F49A9D5|nr:helix-turn-helix transcriptional regulator [Streptomyces boncukensis]
MRESARKGSQHARPHRKAHRNPHSRVRAIRDLSLAELGRLAHVSTSQLSRVENGEQPASPSVLATVARALGVTLSVLRGQPYVHMLQKDQLAGRRHATTSSRRGGGANSARRARSPSTGLVTGPGGDQGQAPSGGPRGTGSWPGRWRCGLRGAGRGGAR